MAASASPSITAEITCQTGPSTYGNPLCQHGLDESKVIKWWGRIQSNPLIDYQHKKAFQISNNETTNYQQTEHGSYYNILFNQCSTTIVRALLIGASAKRKIAISSWLISKAGTGFGPMQVPPELGLHVPTVTPSDVRNLVSAVWGDI
jgi:hypothetical protein